MTQGQTQSLKHLPLQPVHIISIADSKPTFLNAQPVPYAIRPKVETDLDALVKNKLLEPVTVNE